MRGRLAGGLLPLAVLALGLAAGPAAGAATHPVPVGPHVYFKGLVNGHPPNRAVIAVACPAGAKLGKPAPHQTIEVATASPSTTSQDVGYTGSKGRSITATLSLASALTVRLAHFTSFFAGMKIPTNITVPCTGTSLIDFTPAPGSPTAHTAVMSVSWGGTNG